MANITGTNSNDVLTGGFSNDLINGLVGADTMAGGLGNDTYYVDNAGDKVTEDFDEGVDKIVSTVPLSNAFDNVENYDFSKSASPVNFTGNTLDNEITGTAGKDTLNGGSGNDFYYITAQDVVADSSGDDAVAAAFSIDLANYANIESAKLLGSAALNATGNSGSNILVGNSAANILDGKGGIDLMIGGKGNDTFHVDNANDQVWESKDEGYDTVVSSADYTLWTHVEKLVLTGSAQVGVGNTLSNTIIGNGMDNTLNGGLFPSATDADVMKGGLGNDTYFVDSLGDKVVENAGEGTDHIKSSLSYSLAALANVEHLTLLGDAIKATGNALNNGLFGNDKDNILDGGANGDKMSGGKGDDTYYVDNVNDVVEELADEGTDEIISKIALSNAIANVEHYDFSQVTVGLNFTGSDADNVINGGSGIDTLIGGKGNDDYTVNSVKDVIIENAGEGIDTVVGFTFSIDLSKYANVENAGLTGVAALNLTGTTGSNLLFGNAGANVLDGKGGDDTLIGGKGNDTYYVDNVGDKVSETAGGGVDTVISSVSRTLENEVENLKLTGSAVFGTGNSSKNAIIGNDVGNTLDGLGGADVMTGGKGDDTNWVDDLSDKVIELAGEGDDHVKSTVDFSLAGLELENVTLFGGAIKVTGNAKSNVLTGNDQDNIIDGGAGADLMIGGKGNDTYYVDMIGDKLSDTVEELFEGGIDTIVSTVAFQNVIAYVENYDFSKLAGGVTFTGDSNDNVIKGGAGIDTLTGLLGNDTYYVNSAQDKVVEAAFGGSDTVATGAFSIDLANYANVEHAKLVGAAALNATGTGITNILTGNDGANILDGKGGADFLIGGKGNDKYYVDHLGDAITEKAGEGVDTVVSSIFYHEMAANVENLVLAAGVVNASGIGNDSKNLMTGNESDNTFDGGKNADTMKGGEGNDVYYVDEIGDKVVELANQGKDAIISTIDYSLAALGNVEMLRINGNAIKATGNALNNRLIGNDNGNILNGGAGADEMWGGNGDDTYYLDNKGDSIVENAGEGTDTVVSSVGFANVIANVENYDFTKVAVAVTFTGDAANNVIKGGSAIDTLTGGLGNDTYYVNSVKDVIVELAGQGNDTVVTSAFSLDLSKYANVENATLTGTTALNLKGTAGVHNILTGNSAANILDGGDINGAVGDELIGGKGNDKYYIYSISDDVVENANEGIDTVYTTANYVLAANVENLVLLEDTGFGHGNDLNNMIIGNAASNSLDGLDGADTMKGGAGADYYTVDNLGDKVIELAGEGHDSVFTEVDNYILGANVEELHFGIGVVKGTGNALANLIVGNGDSNIIIGGAGADTMKGGAGGDQYYVDNLKDLIVEDVDNGSDRVYSTVALTNGFANVEEYDFSKATSAVTFTGTDAGNYIWSSAFSDTLAGGKGSDTYFLNGVGDKVVELNGEGIDTIITSVSIAKLADNVENAQVRAGNVLALNITGNDLDNGLGGNAANNILNGGKGDDNLFGDYGNDTLIGGAGKDTFAFLGAGTGANSGHDIITDFDLFSDKLSFFMTGDGDGDGVYGEMGDVVASIVDKGAGMDVVLHLLNGGSITFAGVGTGAVNSITELVADPSQIVIS